jgi:hypothetical protein
VSQELIDTVIQAAKEAEHRYIAVSGTTTNSDQWGEFHLAMQMLHQALDRLPKPHVHTWKVNQLYNSLVELTCMGHPVGKRPIVRVENKLPLEVPDV